MILIVLLYFKFLKKILPDRIEACHHVGRTTDTVIVKFSKWKDCQHVCLCCVLNYLVILLNSTDFGVFSFGNQVFYSFFVFGGKCITSISTFATPITNFHAFSLKNDCYWLADLNNVCAQLFPDRQLSLYFLMNIKTTPLQQSIIFNLYWNI